MQTYLKSPDFKSRASKKQKSSLYLTEKHYEYGFEKNVLLLNVFCSQKNISNHDDILNEELIQLINQLILRFILNFRGHALQMKTYISQIYWLV